jgi:hypothetical protein
MKKQHSTAEYQLFDLSLCDTILMMTPNAAESYDLIARSTVIMKSLVSKMPIISMISL